MYDEDIDFQPSLSEWDIPDLPLEFQGEKGSVQFRSLIELSGADVERLRHVIGAAANEGDAANATYAEFLKILITGWDIPGKPQQAIPKGDPRALKTIPALLRRRLERHVKPFMDRLLREDRDEDADPFAPGGPSQPVSA